MRMKNENLTHNLVLYNDPMHSFEHVVEVLEGCIPGMDREKAGKHALQIHHAQRSIIFSGLKEHVEHIHEKIESFECEEKGKILLLPLATEIVKNER